MGLVTTKIGLRNPKEPSLSPLEVDALVDTGAVHLCIPEHIALATSLREIYKREVITADGSRHLCPYVGPSPGDFCQPWMLHRALVLGDEVLLGAVPMKDMDLVISHSRQTIEVNPANPNIPLSKVK